MRILNLAFLSPVLLRPQAFKDFIPESGELPIDVFTPVGWVNLRISFPTHEAWIVIPPEEGLFTFSSEVVDTYLQRLTGVANFIASHNYACGFISTQFIPPTELDNASNI